MTGELSPPWSPMSTAPTDGTRILMVTQRGKVEICSYELCDAGGHWENDYGEARYEGLAWAPCPAWNGGTLDD